MTELEKEALDLRNKLNELQAKIDAEFEENNKPDNLIAYLKSENYSYDKKNREYSKDVDKVEILVDIDDTHLIIRNEYSEMFDDYFDTYDELLDYLKNLKISKSTMILTLEVNYYSINDYNVEEEDLFGLLPENIDNFIVNKEILPIKII